LTITIELDFLDRVQLINFVRSEVKEGRPLPKVWTTSLFEDEQYLKPSLEDDAVLYSLDDIDESALGAETAPDDSEQEVQELRERLAQLQLQFTAYREEVQVSLQHQLSQIKDSPDTTTTNTQPKDPQSPISTSQADQDSGYFTSYASTTIHSTMLKDTIRTNAYRDFIYTNKHLFADKTILDLGCGTGILSLFCARAGARHIIAVDNSPIIDQARIIVYSNGLQDRITCLRGRIEDVHLPCSRVDIIISEWMGYGLLYESMLDSVIWARDRYLDPEAGLMVPSHATLRLAPLIDADELREEHLDFWNDVYGFDMGAMREVAHADALVRTVPAAAVPVTSSPVLSLNLHTAVTSDLTFRHDFAFAWPSSSEPPTTTTATLDGFTLWFDIFFLKSRTENLPTPDDEVATAIRRGNVAFSTSPFAQETHWQQVALLTREVEVGWEPGQLLRGSVGYQRKEGRGRSLEIEVVWGKGEGGEDREVGEVGGVEEKGEGEVEVEEKKRKSKRKNKKQVWALD
jgi:type I protein arginine methyltransferase